MTDRPNLSPYLMLAMGSLPSPGTLTWGVARKAAVVIGVRRGAITREDALARYMLSREELATWERTFDREGISGLRLKCRGLRQEMGATVNRGHGDKPSGVDVVVAGSQKGLMLPTGMATARGAARGRELFANASPIARRSGPLPSAASTAAE